MHRITRAVVLAVPALAGQLMLAAPALADSGTSAVTLSNWYWAEKSTSDGLPVQGELSNVPDGDVGVGYVPNEAGTPDKAAAMAFDLGGIPANSTVSKFAVTLTLDPAVHQLANGSPSVVACRNIEAFAPAPGPSPIAGLPKIEDATCVAGKADAAKGTYTFDLARFATDWASGDPDFGVTFMPKPSDSTPFSLTFKGPLSVAVDLTFTPPVTVVQPNPQPNQPPTPQQPATGGYTGGSGTLTPTTPIGSVTVPQAPAAPVAVPPVVAQPTAVQPAAAVSLTSNGTPTAPFWVAAAGVLLLLTACSWILGGAAPTVAPTSPGRLEKLVRARRTRPEASRVPSLSARLA